MIKQLIKQWHILIKQFKHILPLCLVEGSSSSGCERLRAALSAGAGSSFRLRAMQCKLIFHLKAMYAPFSLDLKVILALQQFSLSLLHIVLWRREKHTLAISQILNAMIKAMDETTPCHGWKQSMHFRHDRCDTENERMLQVLITSAFITLDRAESWELR